MPIFTNLEIVVSDPDLTRMCVRWAGDGETAFIEQDDISKVTSHLMLNVEEAKQTIAALSAFVADRKPHMSDCALHNSPAEPIEMCSCR